ncbi:NifU family protein [Streptomyces sp. ALI-76-A]|jgi:Fe-S cluster biogenesis protein NfuA|uniref:NifU family protein n=1 Tax=Streptomyces sp. ALI-76-A TaxID=3025736 RepID=UPI00256F35A7|nr:NifU family protein [Streptomyces sp. ALI-76-A]MDL5206405.1 NifU family protein [Streptomyces sp. ALI-76-A]
MTEPAPAAVAEPSEGAGPALRLDDGEVAARIARIDELLEKVQIAPGPMAQTAIDAVRVLTEVYGEALARVLDHADAALAERLTEDELLGHLLVLHDLHPEPPDRRAARAVERLRPAVRERGGDVTLDSVEGPVARVRLRTAGCGSGCGSASTGVEEAVREAVLAVAPELTSVETVPETESRQPAFVPVDSLMRRPAAPQGST